MSVDAESTSAVTPPEWTTRVDALVRDAASQILILAASTPQNARTERELLTRAFRNGERALPRWEYAPVDVSRAIEQLRAAGKILARVQRVQGDERELANAYSKRCAELALEANLATHVGMRPFAKLAAKRYARAHEIRERASRLANEFVNEPFGADTSDEAAKNEATMRSSDLAAALKRSLARLRVLFEVRIVPDLAALAATGDTAIYVGSSRRMTPTQLARTVVHETLAHVLPRIRARALPLGLFSIGTARGTDDQEGYALVLEARHGFLVGERRRELGARHLAVEWMTCGADFADVVTQLDHAGVSLEQSIRIAERTFRGGDGQSAGLGRERVYLESFDQVRTALDRNPADENVLWSGQIAIDEIPVLRRYAQPLTLGAQTASDSSALPNF